MFLRPQLPETPTPNLPTTAQQVHVPACGCQHPAPLAPPPHRSLPSVSSGALAAVVVGGVVLVALLAAVVVTAVSVAVAALVLRSLLGSRSGIHHR
ncbi:hypothetical protein [Streptomyces qinglanensis]|uniref:SpdD protein n=1 Tax=Streptomyces qinglanensis TaxID=943816 RepID=A0A1H9VMQ9_9ACTN|nr:hypothetical protein [Streptomyces qinglanensis]SES23080.1 hypothetical protein SAMN05421870_112210 [Streptomyces qinglanensis]SES28555.1 hypothetical protein SAMN05421870_1152 [Streptomyces qinglanensis]